MPKVLCSHPNASSLINGVRFAPVPAGMLSEEVSDDIAAQFAAIPHYTLVASPPAKRPGKAEAADPESDKDAKP